MTDHSCFLDVHILHSVPLSNLNRDNIGSPKQMGYGGATRARISSQCAKRAARIWLERNTNLGRALRTRRLPQHVREELVRDHGLSDPEACQLAKQAFAWVKPKAGDRGVIVEHVGEDGRDILQSRELTFTTADTAAGIAAAIADHADEIRSAIEAEAKTAPRPFKAKLESLLGEQNPVIALCGRMLANLPASNVDGAVQVAHSFSTHRAEPELDYFTAVDDATRGGDTPGSAHINVNEFTTGTFYKHATIGLGLLADALDGSAEATADTAASFVKAFTVAEPTGKQNAANAHTLPALVAVTLRADRPVSLASAFEAPVDPAEAGGYMAASAERLAAHAAAVNALYGTDHLIGAWHAADPAISPADPSGLGDNTPTLDALLEVVEQAVRQALGEGR